MQDKPETQNGKELDDLLRLHAERLRAFVGRRVSNREDAEDIVQDTLLQLLRSLSILQNPIGQVSAWLYTVAHNLIVNHDRKHRESEWPYHLKVRPKDVEWSSQHMFSLGTIIVLGLVLHLVNFWSKMMYAELAETADMPLATDGIYHIVNTFHGIGEHSVMGYVYTALYLVWLTALWYHLNHGIWSSLQTLGWNNSRWFDRLRLISRIWATVIVLMFAAVAIAFCAGYMPADASTLITAAVVG